MKISQLPPKLLVFVRFFGGGLINTGMTYALYFALQMLFFYQIAYALAYLAGIAFSYWFNSVIVFKTKLNWKSLLNYPLVYIAQYCVSALLLGAFIERLDISPKFAPLIVLVATIPLTFFMSRWILRGSQVKI
jgi:putative flippase GtrA